MKSPWLQLMLLFIYFLLVLVATRLLDLILWYQHGLTPTQVVNPLLLKVKQIKLLLDSRGVNYAEYFEHSELVQLLEDSAEVMVGEVEQVSETTVPLKERLKPAPIISHFSGGAHFYEQVEDTRDSVWLVQVVTSNEPLLDDYNWRLVCGQLQPFGVRIGIFDCRQDYKLCEAKNWSKPLLLLAMPKGQRAKDKVILQPFTSTKPQVIVNWVHQQMSLWVKRVKTIEEVENDWLVMGGNETAKLANNDRPVLNKSDSAGSSNVRVLLLSHLLQPPLFLAALSIKFTGRVNFGMFNVKKDDTDAVRKRLCLNDKKLPVYLVVTPEKKVTYGSRKLEYFNMWSMNVFLCGIQPETNDVFLCSLFLVNMLVGLTVCLTSTHLWWRWTVYCLWALVKYNFWLFTAWLVFLALARFTVFATVTDQLLFVLRMIGLSGWGSLVRTEVALLTLHPMPFLFSFISFSLCVSCLIRLFASSWLISSPTDFELDPRPWWASLSRPMRVSELESEAEMLIERLAVPNLWLQPVIPIDYIKDLPVWRYHDCNAVEEQPEVPGCTKDKLLLSASPKLLEEMMDAEDPQNLVLCCCVCTRSQVHTLSIGSCMCSQALAHSHTTISCSCLQATSPHSTISCSCVHGPSSSHSACSPKNLFNAFTLETGLQPSQCFCALVPGWSGTPSHNCQGPFTTPDQCQNCLDNCENLRTGRSRQTMCVACTHRCMNSQWYSYKSCNLMETDLDESDFSDFNHISWTVPDFMLPTTDCAVCLESYNYGSVLCGLPCGHNYHQRCILAWLQRDKHHCPVCRWPAYRSKNQRHHLHQE